MASKLCFLGLLLFVLSSVARLRENSTASTPADEAADIPCVKELLPCQQYLDVPTPPAQCCVPLLSAIEKKAACLCAVFYSEPILKALSLTQEEALRLPRNCGSEVPDIGTCENGGGISDGPTTSWLPEAEAKHLPSPDKVWPPTNGPSPSSAASAGNRLRAAALPVLAGGIACLAMLLLG